jgi:hypothetical protein
MRFRANESCHSGTVGRGPVTCQPSEGSHLASPELNTCPEAVGWGADYWFFSPRVDLPVKWNVLAVTAKGTLDCVLPSSSCGFSPLSRAFNTRDKLHASLNLGHEATWSRGRLQAHTQNLQMIRFDCELFFHWFAFQLSVPHGITNEDIVSQNPRELSCKVR